MTSTVTPFDIVAAVKSVVQDAPRPVALHEPLLDGNESAYVQSCIAQGWVSTAGPFVERFERELAGYCGARFAAATVSGTAALQVALHIAGVAPQDEVLVPSLTFVATANAVAHAGGVPHFVEVEEDSLGIDPDRLDRYLSQIVVTKTGNSVNRHTGSVIRALVPVHVFGHPCQREKLRHVADKYGLVMIEDATEALGSLYHGRSIGSDGMAVFSFNGNKIITTGGGGAVVTDDEAVYKRIKHVITTAKQPHPWGFAHDEIAWNYRMPSLNAAMGCAQLQQMPRFIAAKRALASRYYQAFASLAEAEILMEPQLCQSNYWLVTLMLQKADKAFLDNTMQALHDAGLLCRPVWTPLHLLPMYRSHPRSDLALTENLSMRLISLPSSVKLGLAYA